MQKLNRFGQLAAVAVLAAGVSLPASALTINLVSGANTNGHGNSISYSGTDYSMIAKGYSNTNHNGSLATAEVYRWGTGLGVCNRGEGTVNAGFWQRECSTSTEHQVDNSGNKDLVAFFFGDVVGFESVFINPYGTRDRDISYWVGTVGDGFSLSGKQYADLGTNGFGSRTDVNNSRSSNGLSIGLTGTGNALLVSASILNSDGFKDSFKVGSLNINSSPDTGDDGGVTPVPLPAAAWLMMSGLAAYGFTARKRKANA